MSSNTHSYLSTTRTYRFNPIQANELYKTAKRLGITESSLVRTLLKTGVDKIWGKNES